MVGAQSDARYTFMTEWNDKAASVIRTYQLTYHAADDTIEMFDIKNRRPFLKRTECPSIKLSDLTLGAAITIFSRQHTIKDYGDACTAKRFAAKSETCAEQHPASFNHHSQPATHSLQHTACHPQPAIHSLPPAAHHPQPADDSSTGHPTDRSHGPTSHAESHSCDEFSHSMPNSYCFPRSPDRTVACIPSNSMHLLGKLIDGASSAGLKVTEMRMLQLSPVQSAALFPDGSGSDAAACSQGPLVAMKLAGEDAAARWRQLKGEAAETGDKVTAPTEDLHAHMQAQFLFCSKSCPPLRPQQPAAQSSLLLVRPHAVRDGKLGQIVDHLIQGGFEVVCCQMLRLTLSNSENLFEVYKGVLPEHSSWVEEAICGTCVALQLVFKKDPEASVVTLRELCGARDPEVASCLHKGSVRALFGETKTKNAVHCTDVPQDAQLEIDKVFSMLGDGAASAC